MICVFSFFLLSLFVEYSIESSKVIVLPKNPSKVSKYVPEGQQPNAITEALDKVCFVFFVNSSSFVNDAIESQIDEYEKHKNQIEILIVLGKSIRCSGW